jgi:molybdate transport system regulatory protein
MQMKKNVVVTGRLWLEIDGMNFLGSGRVELLEKIESLGSLRKAAFAMGLSYRRAYYSIKSVNAIAPAPLVELKQGGQGGGSAKLTETGRKFVSRYNQLSHDFVIFITKQSAQF